MDDANTTLSLWWKQHREPPPVSPLWWDALEGKSEPLLKIFQASLSLASPPPLHKTIRWSRSSKPCVWLSKYVMLPEAYPHFQVGHPGPLLFIVLPNTSSPFSCLWKLMLLLTLLITIPFSPLILEVLKTAFHSFRALRFENPSVFHFLHSTPSLPGCLHPS